jgi:hypothetical protein
VISRRSARSNSPSCLVFKLVVSRFVSRAPEMAAGHSVCVGTMRLAPRLQAATSTRPGSMGIEAEPCMPCQQRRFLSGGLSICTRGGAPPIDVEQVRRQKGSRLLADRVSSRCERCESQMSNRSWSETCSIRSGRACAHGACLLRGQRAKGPGQRVSGLVAFLRPRVKRRRIGAGLALGRSPGRGTTIAVTMRSSVGADWSTDENVQH